MGWRSVSTGDGGAAPILVAWAAGVPSTSSRSGMLAVVRGGDSLGLSMWLSRNANVSAKEGEI